MTAREVGQQGNEHGAVLEPQRVRREAWVSAELRNAGKLAQALELLIIVGAKDDVAVAGGEDLIGHGVRMRRAPAAWDLAGEQVVEPDVVEPADLHVEQRDIDVLSGARAIAMAQGAQDADGGV
jgi:hypothetical protein